MYYVPQVLLDTCAIADIKIALGRFPFPPFITQSVLEEMKTKAAERRCNPLSKKDERMIVAGKFSRAVEFYENNPQFILNEEPDPTLAGIHTLTAKQLAYDVFLQGRGKIYLKDVAGRDFTEFGSLAGKLLLDRIHKRGAYRDELIGQIMQTALDAQRQGYVAAKYYGGRLTKPNFAVDLGLVSTARKSPVFLGGDVRIISSDRDVKNMVTFSPGTSDRVVRYLHPRDFCLCLK